MVAGKSGWKREKVCSGKTFRNGWKNCVLRQWARRVWQPSSKQQTKFTSQTCYPRFLAMLPSCTSHPFRQKMLNKLSWHILQICSNCWNLCNDPQMSRMDNISVHMFHCSPEIKTVLLNLRCHGNFTNLIISLKNQAENLFSSKQQLDDKTTRRNLFLAFFFLVLIIKSYFYQQGNLTVAWRVLGD